MLMYIIILLLAALPVFFTTMSMKERVTQFVIVAVVLVAAFEASQFFRLIPETFLSLLWTIVFLGILASVIFGSLHSFQEKRNDSRGTVSILLSIGLIVVSLGITMFAYFSAEAKFEQVKVIDTQTELPAFDENATPISVPMNFAKNKMRKSFGQVPNSSYYELGRPQIQRLNGESVYVATVEFTGWTRWNKQKVAPGYFVLSATDTSANPKFIKSDIKYMPSAYFSYDAERTLFNAFPKVIRNGGIQFEVNDDGKGYFFQSYGEYMVGNGGFVPKGILLLDSQTGKVEKFALKDVPTWIDASISSSSVKHHNEVYGLYPHGFWNAKFSQQDVIIPTLTGNESGVTPIFFEDEMFYFVDFESPKEGIDSMMGYTLTNARTGEITLYSGVDTSFMDSNGARAVSNKKFVEKQWEASVPLLYNFFGETTWLVSMTDQNGFLQQIAVVSAENPEIFASSTSTKDALKKYKAALSGNVNQSINGDSTAEIKSEAITVTRSYKEKVEDQTVVYLLDNQGRMFVVSSELNPKVLFIEEGDNLSIEFNETTSAIYPVVSIELSY